MVLPIVAHALAIDGFGNVALNVGHEDALDAGIRMGNRVAVNGVEASRRPDVRGRRRRAALLYEDAWQALALAVNRGDAAARLGLERDAEVLLESLGRG